MTKYILKRIGMAVLTVFIIITLTFFLMHAVPGGPFDGEKAVPPAVMDALNAKYGFDKPVPEQYVNYLGKLLQGDLGVSLKKKGLTVNELIAPQFKISAKIGGLSAVFALLLGIPLGAFAAVNRGKFWDKLIMIFATASVSIPGFVLAALLMIIIGVNSPVLPVSWDNTLAAYVLPVIAIMVYPCAYITRLMRSSMLDVLDQDYIRTARAKGVMPFPVLFKHSLRNAIMPIITYMGPMITYILLGSFAVETVFSIPGLGRSFIDAALNRDYFLIMGTTIFLAALMVGMNLVVDLLYTVVDPRIKLS